MTEEQIQAACFQWHWNTFPKKRRLLFHTYNNSHSRTEGAIKKAIGVVAGVSDLVLVHWNAVYFIELKTDKGIQKPEQKDFQQKVEMMHHVYLVVRSVEEFKTLINTLYENEQH